MEFLTWGCAPMFRENNLLFVQDTGEGRGLGVPAKVYTELPLKRAICLYMGTIGEAPEVSRGPISYLYLGIILACGGHLWWCIKGYSPGVPFVY